LVELGTLVCYIEAQIPTLLNFLRKIIFYTKSKRNRIVYLSHLLSFSYHLFFLFVCHSFQLTITPISPEKGKQFALHFLFFFSGQHFLMAQYQGLTFLILHPEHRFQAGFINRILKACALWTQCFSVWAPFKITLRLLPRLVLCINKRYMMGGGLTPDPHFPRWRLWPLGRTHLHPVICLSFWSDSPSWLMATFGACQRLSGLMFSCPE